MQQKLKLYLKFQYEIDNWDNRERERERNGVGQGDGSKSILQKNLWQNPKAPGRLQEPGGKPARLETVSKEIGYSFPLDFIQGKKKRKKKQQKNRFCIHSWQRN